MKRRSFFQGAAVLPALPAAAQYAGSTGASNELPKLTETAPDAVGDGVRTLFTPEQLATLRRLAELLVPAVGERPGAVDCSAVEFLDFLLKASPAPRQTLYRNASTRSPSHNWMQQPRTPSLPRFASHGAMPLPPILSPASFAKRRTICCRPPSTLANSRRPCPAAAAPLPASMPTGSRSTEKEHIR